MKEIKKKTRLEKLETFGQSVWLDYIHRDMIRSGQLRKLIEEYSVSGVTSNPAIFEKAIDGSHDYDDDIGRFIREGKNAKDIYETLTVRDVQDAADVFRPVYDKTQGRDGFVSLEVSPLLARDTQATICEARKLWQKVNRPNLLIKIPATAEGLPAIRQCITDGININVTLLFGLSRYLKVITAYIEGLEAFVANGKSPDRIVSVASFFLSRIDVLVDSKLDGIIKNGPSSEIAQLLHGQVAIACAKVAYQTYKEIFGSKKFRGLADKGARPQRLLWASTGVKNPSYRDTKYVESLIGPETVNTIPMETLEAYGDHGSPASRLEEGGAQANHLLAHLSDVGILLDDVVCQLEEEGIAKFVKSYDSLIERLMKKGAPA